MFVNLPEYLCGSNKRKMRTFILKWDPDHSPYGLVDFQRDFPKLEYGLFSWKLEEYEGLRSGDNFFLVKTGKGNCGVVMKGFFISDPFPVRNGGDSSTKVNLRPTYMFHPDSPKGILRLDELRTSIPDFPWEEGISGRRLSGHQTEILGLMWDRFLEEHDNGDYDGILADRNRRPDAGIDDAVALASEVLYDREDINGEPLILKSLRSGLSGTTIEEKIRGFLLDVMSDPEWDAGALREKGFSETVVESLLA